MELAAVIGNQRLWRAGIDTATTERNRIILKLSMMMRPRTASAISPFDVTLVHVRIVASVMRSVVGVGIGLGAGQWLSCSASWKRSFLSKTPWYTLEGFHCTLPWHSPPNSENCVKGNSSWPWGRVAGAREAVCRMWCCMQKRAWMGGREESMGAWSCAVSVGADNLGSD